VFQISKINTEVLRFLTSTSGAGLVVPMNELGWWPSEGAAACKLIAKDRS